MQYYAPTVRMALCVLSECDNGLGLRRRVPPGLQDALGGNVARDGCPLWPALLLKQKKCPIFRHF